MENLLSVTLEAHNPERGISRWYELAVGRDLMSAWTVTVCHGRSGQGGQERRCAADNPDPLRALIRRLLLRRLSAPRRIGCRYRLVSETTLDEVDTASWLPTDLMTRFRQGSPPDAPITGRTARCQVGPTR